MIVLRARREQCREDVTQPIRQSLSHVKVEPAQAVHRRRFAAMGEQPGRDVSREAERCRTGFRRPLGLVREYGRADRGPE